MAVHDPLSTPASHTEFPGCSTERDKSNRAPELKAQSTQSRQSRYPERPREPRCAEQSITTERNAQRENSRDLQRVPLKYLRVWFIRRRKIIKICMWGWGVSEKDRDTENRKKNNKEKSIKAKAGYLKKSIKFINL